MGREIYPNMFLIRYANSDLNNSFAGIHRIVLGASNNWIKLLKAGTFVRNYLIPVETSFNVSTSSDLHITRITITPYS